MELGILPGGRGQRRPAPASASDSAGNGRRDGSVSVLNVVYSFALSASDVRAIADRDGFEAVAPIAQLAASRLFGERWSTFLSIAFGLMLLVDSERLCVDRAAGRVCHGPGRPVSIAGRQVVAQARRHPPSRPAFRWRRPGVALDGNTGKHHRLRGCRPLDFLDAGDELDLCLALARPDLPRPFRTPGYPVTPAIYLLSTAALTLATFHDRPAVSFYALVSILAGIPFYYIWKSMAPVA